MKIKKILVTYTIPLNSEQRKTLETVKKEIQKTGISFHLCERTMLDRRCFENVDLIIPVGGDGTFLQTSHFVSDSTLFFGVNMDPTHKEGFFMVANRHDFVKKLDRVLHGLFKIRRLHRLQAFVDGKKIKEQALNEYYISSKVPYHTARYHLYVKGKKEMQKSSGVLVSTAAGSHAWVKSAGGKVLPVFSEKFEFVVREPYYGRTAKKCHLRQGLLSKHNKISIIFELFEGIIIADSTAKEHTFMPGQKVEVTMSKYPISVVAFK